MIAVRNLHKAYGAKTVLADVSCEFPAGRVTSLIGPNGAGKSTLLMLMARLHAPPRARSCWTAATPAPSASPTTPGAWPRCASRQASTCA